MRPVDCNAGLDTHDLQGPTTSGSLDPQVMSLELRLMAYQLGIEAHDLSIQAAGWRARAVLSRGPTWDTLGGSRAGSYLRLIDSCITQLKAQGPSRTCTESNEKEEATPSARRRGAR